MKRSVMAFRPRRPAAGGPVRAGGIAILAVAAALGGCAVKTDLTTGSVETDDYRKRHPIVLQDAEQTLDIPVGRGTAGLDGRSRDAVMAFASEARDRGTGPLVIMVPSGSGNEAAANYLAGSIRKTATGTGLSSGNIVTQAYRVQDPNVSAPIRLSFTQIKAGVPHPCGMWKDNAYRGFNNDSDDEFGCASQSNLAAMVANPEDLIGPRATTPVSVDRRAVVLRKWIAGEKTATEYGDDADGRSSDVGN
ncbi:CpaD family pilus assembly protein [Methylobrevis pamukkalensis]|uniref:Pilus biogenesis CpaD protein n=1 Tax=Methylobrevis pamukkalensis TaxID=1439726 RepID=A0A1E3H3N6_9HYPH|nr:CpaD family pilus assembly protein [Methylobrevis pamukkalensis]ODN70904.1 Pilus biogenesis CpaD protein [Methylobrevis pamukkalensis]